MAPVLRWAQEVWSAALPQKRTVPALHPLLLKRAWKTVEADPPLDWEHARGALDCAVLSARRIGWRFQDENTLITDLEAVIPLKDTAPKLMAKLLREGVQRMWQRRMAEGLRKSGWDGARVCPDPIEATLRSKWASKNPVAAHYAARAFCGGIWTAERAALAGYDCQGALCPLCNAAEDTLEHRIVYCTAACGTRAEHKRAFREIRDGYRGDELYCFRGIMDHPADRMARPPKSGGAETAWSAEWPEDDRHDELLSGGEVFCDGSASRHAVAELRRAAWAIHFTTADGSPKATVSGPVWEHLPQTPQAAEYLSAVAAIQLLRQPSWIIGDCLGVVEAISNLKAGGAVKGMHAGLLKDTISNGNIEHVSGITWMPSHCTVSAAASPKEVRWNKGNATVDQAAGDMREIEEQRVGAQELEAADSRCKMAAAILRAVGSVLALWPALPRAVARKDAEPKASLRVDHEWVYSAYRRHWHCKACGTFSLNDKTGGPPKRYGKCRPGRTFERVQRATELGHDLAVVEVRGTPTHYCVKCAARATWQWRSLLDVCREEPCRPKEWKWLELAKEGGAQLELQRSSRQRGTEDSDSRKPNQRTRRRRHPKKGGSRSEPDPEPLRNALNASLADRRRWESLECGSCWLNPLNGPMPRPEGHRPGLEEDEAEEHHAAATRPRADQSPASVEHRRLGPASGDPDGPDDQCPNCAGTVLATDTRCEQCGLERSEEAEDAGTELEAVDQRHGRQQPEPPPQQELQIRPALKTRQLRSVARISFAPEAVVTKITSFKAETLWWRVGELSSPRGRPAKAKTATPLPLDQQGAGDEPDSRTVGAKDDAPACHWWHGGTLAPPPFLAGTRPPEAAPQLLDSAEDPPNLAAPPPPSLSPEQARRTAENRRAAQSRKEAKRAADLNRRDGLQPPGGAPQLPEAAEEPNLAAPPPPSLTPEQARRTADNRRAAQSRKDAKRAAELNKDSPNGDLHAAARPLSDAERRVQAVRERVLARLQRTTLGTQSR